MEIFWYLPCISEEPAEDPRPRLAFQDPVLKNVGTRTLHLLNKEQL